MSEHPIFDFIISKLQDEKLHMTLVDPGTMDADTIGRVGALAQKAGTTAIMVGGSTLLNTELVDACVLALRRETSLPIILFPPSASTLSRHADALYFMSMLNSKELQFVVGEQLKGAPKIKSYGLEPIPMGYIVVEPGMAVGQVGRANLIPRDDPEKAMHYCLMAQYLGMKLVYLEAGSGAPTPVPAEMVRVVKQSIDIPLIVGGGIRTPEQALDIVMAGADIIVTGTLVEETDDVFKALEHLISDVRTGLKD